ncbi:hypothetical protein NEOLEDRAFT_658220 [Neolentinus lepideus HHB14362 ss-1]|uniref:F-box domain-containing protein n=1 Tax=Neolentinus lepideus HHB14362 ss-1 TaxID=1314782 RepID=A0A165QG09_9AGAM|nr:hypothetical protein NEOLEDRAFT_658220 [Neolentinus lepideus HHB14362 ss-1]
MMAQAMYDSLSLAEKAEFDEGTTQPAMLYLLDSNDAPSEGQRRVLVSSLSTVIREQAGAEEEVLVLEEQLEEARSRRDALSKLADKHHGALSLLRTIPPELLSQIFVHCLPPDDHYPSSRTPPLTISQVCCAWRAIALRTPRLWSTVGFILSEVSRDEIWTSLMKLWLARAGACPLGLTYTCPGIDARECTKYLVQNLSRCRRLELHLSTVVLTTDIPSVDLPLLDSLIIYANYPHHYWDQDIDAFNLSPMLRSFSLVWDNKTQRSSGSRYPIVHFVLPYSRLTELELTGLYYVASILKVLENCETLETCTIKDCETHPLLEDLESLPDVCLPSLHTFDLGAVDSTIILLRMLTLPSLRHLHVGSNGELTSPPVIALLSRSRCQLETLKLSFYKRFFRRSADFLEFARSMPSLTTLHLCCNRPDRIQFWDDATLETLTYKPAKNNSSPCLLPNLRDLNIKVRGPDDANVSAEIRLELESQPSSDVAEAFLRSRSKHWVANSGHAYATLERGYVGVYLPGGDWRFWSLSESGEVVTGHPDQANWKEYQSDSDDDA